MNQQIWTAVDTYLNEAMLPPDEALEAALAMSVDAGLPAIQVAPNQGKLLNILARAIGARRILEMGTLGGYSTIWMAYALPADGHLVTLEVDARHAEVATASIARAGLADRVTLMLGPALDSLPMIQAQGDGPFDLIFIDADKVNLAAYFDWALKLARVGSLIIVDNVVRNGAVTDETSEDPGVQGVRRFMRAIAAEPRVTATGLQTVGSKGYDGLAIALVTSL